MCSFAKVSNLATHSRLKRISMDSIAQELGISIATVSRVLNEKPGISEGVRTQVSTLLKKRGYQRSKAKTHKSKLHSVAFVVSDDLLEMINKGNDYYGRHLVAVQRATSRAGFYPVLVGHNQDMNANGMLRCVAEKRVQAVIGEIWLPDLAEQIAQEVPVVLFNRSIALEHVDMVTTDIQSAAQVSLEYLYDLGHRCIANFRNSEPYCSWEESYFWQQYFSFAKAKNLLLPPSLLEPINFGVNGDLQAARAFVHRVLAGKVRPTAIVSYDNYMPSLITALHEHGVKIPEEMSLIGFNDLKEAAELPVPLTTYRQNFDALAQEAMRLILDRTAHPSFPGRRVRIPGKLIKRKSAVPPPV